MALSQLSVRGSVHPSALVQSRATSHAEASCSTAAPIGGGGRSSALYPAQISRRAESLQKSVRCVTLKASLLQYAAPSFTSPVFPLRSTNCLPTEGLLTGSRNASESYFSSRFSQGLGGPHNRLRSHSRKRRSLLHSCFTVSASAATTLPTISLKNYSPEPFVRVGECLVLTPSVANPKTPNASPRGIIAFYGGAFVGAVPAFTYRFLLTQLAAAGYLVVAVPYQLTFDHRQSADVIERRLQNCLELLYAQEGVGIGAVPGLKGSELKKLPVFGVGHSNGALLHLLTNSIYSSGVRPKANVIISFNNKPASEAVPGFDQFGPAAAQIAPALKGSPFQGLAEAFASEATRLAASVDLPIPGLPRENLGPLLEITGQIAPVIAQITDGMSEFRPAPHETLAIAAASYNAPSTLLVKFTDDSIDETDSLAAAIRAGVQSRGGRLRIQDLTGNHVTPLIQEVKWDVGPVYTPFDAVRQTVQTAALADTRRLVTAIVSYLDSNL